MDIGVMKRFVAIFVAASFFSPAVLAQQDERPAASADRRGPGANTLHKHLFCVKNAESGVCEDCWSDGKISSARGTCNLLKASSNAPDVRQGKCALPSNRKFCALKK
jgi:hypothetical protein